MTEVLFENKLVKLEFDSTVPCIIWTPLDFMSGEDFTGPFVIGVDFYVKNFQKYPNITWLNDTRKLKTARPLDVQWLNKNVNDKLFAVGGTKVAFVSPENIVGRLAINMYITFTNMRSDNKFQIKIFKTMQEAITWFKEPLKN